MILNKKIKSDIKKHALKEKPKECCGLVFESNGSLNIQACSNTSEIPEKHFSISPRDYLKATQKGSIKAVYHSHLSNNDRFSPNDILHSRAHQLPFLLYCHGKDSFSTFLPQKNKTFLYDRIFKIGESDCYTFVKEYYSNLGIKLAGYNNLGNDWHKKNPNLIQDLFSLNKNDPNLPISELSPKSEFKKHDVLVFEFIKGAGANHVAVYLGNNQIMHHPRNKYLCIESLSNIYKNKIITIYRHDKFS